MQFPSYVYMIYFHAYIHTLHYITFLYIGCITLHYMHKNKHYVTLHCIAFHSTPLHSTTLIYYTPLHTLHYTANIACIAHMINKLHYSTVHHTTVHCITVHSIHTLFIWYVTIPALHYIEFNYITCNALNAHYIHCIHCIIPCIKYITLRTLHYNTLHMALHYNTLQVALQYTAQLHCITIH